MFYSYMKIVCISTYSPNKIINNQEYICLLIPTQKLFFHLAYEGAIYIDQKEILLIIKMHLLFLNIRYILLSKHKTTIAI